jgi:hypothetical protein
MAFFLDNKNSGKWPLSGKVDYSMVAKVEQVIFNPIIFENLK